MKISKKYKKQQNKNKINTIINEFNRKYRFYRLKNYTLDKFGIEHACSCNEYDMLRCIIEYSEYINYKINIYTCMKYIFFNACSGGNPKIFNYLINYYNKYNYKIDMEMFNNCCFVHAHMYHNIRLIKYLINLNVINNYYINIQINIDNLYCIEWWGTEHFDIIKLLFEYYNKQDSKINVQIYKYNEDETEKIIIDNIVCIKNIFEQAYYCCNLNIFKYFIEYYERINNKINIDIEIYINRGLSISMYNSEIHRYIIYLHKHNYRNISNKIYHLTKNILITKQIDAYHIFKQCVINNHLYIDIQHDKNLDINYIMCIESIL